MNPAVHNLFQYALNVCRNESTAAQAAYSAAHDALKIASDQLERELEQEKRVVQDALDLGATREELVEHFGEYVGSIIDMHGLTAR